MFLLKQRLDITGYKDILFLRWRNLRTGDILLRMPPQGRGGSQTQTLKPLQLPGDFVAAYRRRLIMDAAAELIAELGYNGTRLADITRRAGIPQDMLYEYFGDKEDVCLAVFEETVDDAIRRVEVAVSEPGEWAERIEAGLAAFLAHIAEQPALARVCLIEVPLATPAATKHYEDALQRCVQLARRTLPHDAQLPDTIQESLVGGMMWIVYQQVRRREAEQIEALLPELSEFILAPYIGAGVIDRAGCKADR